MTFAGAIGVSGCGYLPMATSPDLVPIAPITASLKCAFAKALKEESKPGHIERLRGRVVAGTLTLKVVDDRNLDVGFKDAGPFILALASPIPISPSFSLGYHAVNTVSTKINFRMKLEANNLNACYLSGGDVDTFGFSSWLGAVIAGLNVNPTNTQPKGVVESITYEGDFAVTRKASGGFGLDIVTISPTLDASASRNDVQNITFTIAPQGEKNPYPDWTRNDGPFLILRPKLRLPNLF